MPQKSKARNHRASGIGFSNGLSTSGDRVSGRIWIERNGETLLSWGRVVLLERIQEYGSISAAARSMGMGYRHAWELVEQMNRLSPKKLVAKKTGGEGGGGAVLTRHGETAIKRFWELVTEFREWLSPIDPELWEQR